MALVHRLSQRMANTGTDPDHGRLLDAEFHRDGVGCHERHRLSAPPDGWRCRKSWSFPAPPAAPPVASGSLPVEHRPELGARGVSDDTGLVGAAELAHGVVGLRIRPGTAREAAFRETFRACALMRASSHGRRSGEQAAILHRVVRGDEEGRPAGVFRIGTMESTAAARLPAILSRYHALHREVRIEIETDAARGLPRRRAAGFRRARHGRRPHHRRTGCPASGSGHARAQVGGDRGSVCPRRGGTVPAPPGSSLAAAARPWTARTHATTTRGRNAVRNRAFDPIHACLALLVRCRACHAGRTT